jgi:hypothetical protein
MKGTPGSMMAMEKDCEANDKIPPVSANNPCNL